MACKRISSHTSTCIIQVYVTDTYEYSISSHTDMHKHKSLYTNLSQIRINMRPLSRTVWSLPLDQTCPHTKFSEDLVHSAWSSKNGKSNKVNMWQKWHGGYPKSACRWKQQCIVPCNNSSCKWNSGWGYFEQVCLKCIESARAESICLQCSKT